MPYTRTLKNEYLKKVIILIRNTVRTKCTQPNKEELDADINVGELFETIEYDYPNFHLSMKCFLCTLTSDQLVLKEHEAAKWLTRDNLDSVAWLPADVTIIEKLKNLDF